MTTQEKERVDKEYSKLENLKKQVEAALSEEKKRKSKLLGEAYDLIVNLDRTALKQMSVFTLVHLEFLIERLKETEIDNTEKVRKLEELKSVDENTQKALRYYRYLKSEDKRQ